MPKGAEKPRYFVLRFLGGNLRYYHTHEDCCKIDGKPTEEIAHPAGLEHCHYCAERDGQRRRNSA